MYEQQNPHKDAPPPYGMNPPQPQVVHVTQPVAVVAVPMLGPESSSVRCPSCTATIMTRVTHETSTKTHLIALGLCLVGCCPCALIPYCTDTCKDSHHYCSSCGAFVGVYQK